MWKLWQAVALAACVASTGCGGYGPVSPRAYDYAGAVYGLCSRREAGRLDQLAEAIDQDRQAGLLTDREAGWLGAMVADGRAGDWESAQRASRRMMQDQSPGP